MKNLGLAIASLALSLFAIQPAEAIEWVTVGNPGNPADQNTGFGGVPYVYQISKYEITNAEYADFLDAVAGDDPNGLYDPSMSTLPGGIARSGSPGSFAYDVVPGRGDRPVNFVSFYDALRFANWQHHGRPSGAQGPATTEDGAYTITAEGIAANSITRNSGARVFLTSEDEWYKAAYHGPWLGPATQVYFLYPTRDDIGTICSAPTSAPSRANCDGVTGQPFDTTPVGSYPGSPSPYDTLDQGGNVAEWTEGVSGELRVRRGGGYGSPPTALSSYSRATVDPGNGNGGLGFRVARTSPAVPALPPSGAVLLALLLSLAGAGAISSRRPRPAS